MNMSFFDSFVIRILPFNSRAYHGPQRETTGNQSIFKLILTLKIIKIMIIIRIIIMIIIIIIIKIIIRRIIMIGLKI